jgi:hypothetical protein
MCEPVSATVASNSMMTTLAASSAASASASIFSAANIMRGLSVASGVMSFVGGQQQASASADANSAGLEAFYAQTAEKQKEINEQAAVNQLERRKQGMIDRAEAVTAAGESGALGFTSNRLIADSLMQQGTDVSTIEMNRKNQIKQSDNENKSAYARATGATNQAYANAPGLIETGLQIGTDIYSTEANVERNTKATVGNKYPNYNTASV